VTVGALVAVGRTRWLTMECDNQDRCANVVIDRASGARHVLGRSPSFVNAGTGVISPDGSTAAFLSVNPADGAPILRLLDLASGVDRVLPRAVTTGQAFGNGSLVWSPDSQTLFVARQNGHILAVDARTRHVQDLSTGLTQISQLAIRNPTR
jgi:Tol biopolymer transport system component